MHIIYNMCYNGPCLGQHSRTDSMCYFITEQAWESFTDTFTHSMKDEKYGMKHLDSRCMINGHRFCYMQHVVVGISQWMNAFPRKQQVIFALDNCTFHNYFCTAIFSTSMTLAFFCYEPSMELLVKGMSCPCQLCSFIGLQTWRFSNVFYTAKYWRCYTTIFTKLCSFFSAKSLFVLIMLTWRWISDKSRLSYGHLIFVQSHY